MTTLWGFNVGNGGGEGQSAAQRASDFGTDSWDVARVYGSEWNPSHILPVPWPSDWASRSPKSQMMNVCWTQNPGRIDGTTANSVNGGDYDQSVKNFLAIIPAGWTVYITWTHEFTRFINEADATHSTAAYKAAHIRVAELIRDNQPAALGASAIYALNPNGPNNTTYSNSMVPAASTMPTGTICIFDNYGNSAGKPSTPTGNYKAYGTTYPNANTVADLAYHAADALGYTGAGYAWGIGEFNTPTRVGTHSGFDPDSNGYGIQSPNDLDGTLRADWITKTVNRYLNPPAGNTTGTRVPASMILLWSGAGSLWNQNFGNAGAAIYPKPPQIVSGVAYTGAWPFNTTRTKPVNAFKQFLTATTVVQSGQIDLEATAGLTASVAGNQAAAPALTTTPTLVANPQVIQPLFIGATTDDSVASGGNATFSFVVPVNTSDNDLAVIAIAQGGGQVVTLPTGFAHVPGSPVDNAATIQTTVATKSMSLGDGGTTISGSFALSQRFAAVLIVLRNARLVLNTSALMQRVLSTTNTSIDLPDVTPTTDNCVLVTVATAQTFASAGTYTMSTGAGYTARAEAATITSAARNLGVSIATTLVSAGANQLQAGPTLTSSATNRNNTFLLAFDPVFDFFGTAPLRPTPTLAASSVVTTFGVGDSDNVLAALIVNPDNTALGAAAVSSTPTLVAAGVLTRLGAAAVSAAPTLAAVPLNTIVGAKSMAVTASLLAAGSITGEAATVTGQATVTAAPTLVASPLNTELGAAAVSATPTLVGAAANQANAATAFSATAALTGAAVLTRLATAAPTATPTLVATPLNTAVSAAAASASPRLTVSGTAATTAAAGLSASTTLNADATVIEAEETSGARLHLGGRKPPRIKRR